MDELTVSEEYLNETCSCYKHRPGITDILVMLCDDCGMPDIYHDIKELQTKLDKAIECIEFYANKETYKDIHGIDVYHPLQYIPIEQDEGENARQCLKELKGE